MCNCVFRRATTYALFVCNQKKNVEEKSAPICFLILLFVQPFRTVSLCRIAVILLFILCVFFSLLLLFIFFVLLYGPSKYFLKKIIFFFAFLSLTFAFFISFFFLFFVSVKIAFRTYFFLVFFF